MVSGCGQTKQFSIRDEEALVAGAEALAMESRAAVDGLVGSLLLRHLREGASGGASNAGLKAIVASGAEVP